MLSEKWSRDTEWGNRSAELICSEELAFMAKPQSAQPQNNPERIMVQVPGNSEADPMQTSKGDWQAFS